MVGKSFPENTPTLIVIAGPTAVGKTSVAIDVAEHYATEIISADSRQFYKGLNIGTAAPTPHQLERVKHHFVGFLEPEEYFNVGKFEIEVLDLLKQLFTKHHVVIMTGGSGLYIRAVCKGIDEFPDIDEDIRKNLQDILRNEGLPALRRLLIKHDPLYASTVDPANPNRIIRALEVIMQTGKPYSSFLGNRKTQRDFNIIQIALNIDRSELHERINHRVDKMIEDGLIEEAKSFYAKRHLNSLNTVGYKELFSYFDGELSLENAIEKIKTNTRRYARRQITWFNKDSQFNWLPPDSSSVINYLNNLNIL
ncbi:MAG: tRNA (adenosine(37)-N6)-dimethylallyltransferase MiaA [Omnitrophica WOR_2 bacterium]